LIIYVLLLSKDIDDPEINKYVGLDDCQATAIERMTTFVMTNIVP